MTTKAARAQVSPVRQRTQYTCMSTSMLMCLQACGHDLTEDEVNAVMGARPMKGAAWEQALACAQHFGCRATLTMPATIAQLKEWTDAGKAVMIAWNPEGRDWSHASTVYHVTDGIPLELDPAHQVIGSGPGMYVWVADPNIPNPNKTTRIVHEDEFYGAWYEKWPDYLVRRPACCIEREISVEGRQMVASSGFVGWARGDKVANMTLATRVATVYLIAEAHDCYKDWKGGTLTWEEYQQCVKRFDDQEDVGGYRRPPKPTTDVPDNWRERVNRLLLALGGTTDNVSKKFVGQLAYKTSATPAQFAWFDRLEKKHRQIIADMPDLRNVAFVRGHVQVNKTEMTPSVLRQMGRHFDVVPDRSDDKSLIVQPHTRTQEPAPAPPSAPPSAPSLAKPQLEVLDALVARRPSDSFLKSLRDQVARGRTLSEKQLSAVRQNLYRNQMKDKADLFRAASRSPNQVGTTPVLLRQGLTPVDVFFGETRPHQRPLVMQGDMLQDRRGHLWFFVGLDEDGQAILAKTERELERMKTQLIQDRRHHLTTATQPGASALSVAERFLSGDTDV